MNSESSEKISDTLEKVDESIIAGANTNGGLIYTSESLGSGRSEKETHIQ